MRWKYHFAKTDIEGGKQVVREGERFMRYMDELQANVMPKGNYMSSRFNLTWDHRHRLLEWLLHLHLSRDMKQETLWICANVVDRFLSAKDVDQSVLTLVGIAAMSIALKHGQEESKHPVTELIRICQNQFTEEDINLAEQAVLAALENRISSYCYPAVWAYGLSINTVHDGRARCMIDFVMELTIFDPRFVGVSPSYIAAVGICVANRILGQPWVRIVTARSYQSSLGFSDGIADAPPRIQRRERRRIIWNDYRAVTSGRHTKDANICQVRAQQHVRNECARGKVGVRSATAFRVNDGRQCGVAEWVGESGSQEVGILH